MMDQTPIDHLPKNGRDMRLPRQKSAIAGGRLVSLNFKVPMRVRQQFKIYAAARDIPITTDTPVPDEGGG